MSESITDLRARLADAIGPMLVPSRGLAAGLVGRATRKKADDIAGRVIACIHGEGLSFCRKSEGLTNAE